MAPGLPCSLSWSLPPAPSSHPGPLLVLNWKARLREGSQVPPGRAAGRKVLPPLQI